MKLFGRSLAVMTLGALAWAPGALLAADTLDGLDVTMEVLGDESELGELVSEMRAPDDRGFRGGDLADEDFDEVVDLDAEATRVFTDEPDGFEEDIADRNSELDLEDAFEAEEGDDLDYETYDD